MKRPAPGSRATQLPRRPMRPARGSGCPRCERGSWHRHVHRGCPRCTGTRNARPECSERLAPRVGAADRDGPGTPPPPLPVSPPPAHHPPVVVDFGQPPANVSPFSAEATSKPATATSPSPGRKVAVQQQPPKSPPPPRRVPPKPPSGGALTAWSLLDGNAPLTLRQWLREFPAQAIAATPAGTPAATDVQGLRRHRPARRPRQMSRDQRPAPKAPPASLGPPPKAPPASLGPPPGRPTKSSLRSLAITPPAGFHCRYLILSCSSMHHADVECVESFAPWSPPSVSDRRRTVV